MENSFLCDLSLAVLYNAIVVLLIYIYYVLYKNEINQKLRAIKNSFSKKKATEYYPKISPLGWLFIIVAPLLLVASHIWACNIWPLVGISFGFFIFIVILGLGLLAFLDKLEYISDLHDSIIDTLYHTSGIPKSSVKQIRKWLTIGLLITFATTMIYKAISYVNFNDIESTISSIISEDDNNYPKHVTLLQKYPNTFSYYDKGNDLKRMLAEMDTVKIWSEDLSDMTYEQAYILQKALFAERGMIFSDKQLVSFFENCNWYKGKSRKVPKLRGKDKQNFHVLLGYLKKNKNKNYDR